MAPGGGGDVLSTGAGVGLADSGDMYAHLGILGRALIAADKSAADILVTTVVTAGVCDGHHNHPVESEIVVKRAERAKDYSVSDETDTHSDKSKNPKYGKVD